MKAGNPAKTERASPSRQKRKLELRKKGFYPDDIAGTFGVPVEQHALDSEIRQMDGYVTSGMRKFGKCSATTE